MRILIAGGAGYIGSVLVPMLLSRGHQVDVVDLLWFGNYLPAPVRPTPQDLFDCRESHLQGYDQLIFLAGLSNDPMAEFDPAMNFVHNAALPSYLAYVAKRAGVRRFIYASTCSIYGYTVNELYDEDAPATCAYPYGISKLQGERGVMQLQDDDFSVISLRQGTVCGYSPRMRFDLIVNTMYKTAIRLGKITVNNPAIWRPILDVRDTAAAFVAAVEADPALSGPFNLAYDNFTVGQVAELVKNEVETLTGEAVELEILAKQDFRNYKVSCDRARQELAFSPQYGIQAMIDSLHQQGAEFGDFEADEYYNIRVFRRLRDEGGLFAARQPVAAVATGH